MNIATGRSLTLTELVTTLEQLLDITVDPAYGPPRPGEVTASVADIERAKELLGYEPEIDFVDGLRRTVEWIAALGTPEQRPAVH